MQPTRRLRVATGTLRLLAGLTGGRARSRHFDALREPAILRQVFTGPLPALVAPRRGLRQWLVAAARHLALLVGAHRL